MTHPQVITLLRAVRHRLWRGQFVVAVRLALWGSAASMLLAAAVHLAARPVPVGALLGAFVVLWVSLLARTAGRRPADSDCALWADRHLDGASAYTTLLEMGKAAPAIANASAVRWLEQWAISKVPHSLGLLAERQEPTQLSRPLLSMLVCMALSLPILTLSDPAPSSPQQGAALGSASGHDIAGRPMQGAEALASAGLVNEITSALRSSAASRDGQEQREGGAAATPGAGKTADGDEALTARAGATPAGEKATATDASNATRVEAAPSTATTQVAGVGQGREAGDSQGGRADDGVSRALRGTIPVQGVEVSHRRASDAKQADMNRLGAYDDEQPTRGAAAMRSDVSPAAATPPAATEATRLTATETSYVQAWMKAGERRR